jgi:benzoylformate decarboxylase
VTKWAYEIRTPDEVPQVVRRAMKVAHTPPYGPVLLSLPMDVSEQPCAAPTEPDRPLRTRTRPDPEAVAEAAELILGAANPVVVAGDGIARSGAVDELARLAHLIGAPIRGGFLFETAVDPDDRLGADRLNAGAAEANAVLREHDVAVVAGSKLHRQLFPIAGDQAAGARVVHISADSWELGKNHASTLVWGDERLALTDVTDAVDQQATEEHRRTWEKRCLAVKAELREEMRRQLDADRRTWDATPMTPARAAYEIGRALPEDVCVADESLTSSAAVARYLRLDRGQWFRGRGGGIGEGLPTTVGVKLARPHQSVVGLVSDGASLYAPTALWTAAHHGIPVVWIVLNNRIYRILQDNAVRRRAPSRAGMPFVGTDLSAPPIDFVQVAAGFGVRAHRVDDPDQLAGVVRAAIAAGEPVLIEVVIA